MDSDSTEMVNEIKNKIILHWNCRGLVEFPEAIRIYGSHIQEIYLKWNKLAALPPWIVELFNVTNIYLYGNMITKIPTELCRMSQLTVLDLSANKLNSIPSCIGSLINLKSLLLNENLIDKLPAEMNEMHNLEILSIAGNKFVVLPEWIGSLPKLKELIADNNYLRELPNRLTLSPQLSVISVCSNRLRYLPLNGFLSSPCIRFDANVYLNYLSYPLLYQLTSQAQDSFMYEQRNILGYGCFKTHCENNVLPRNIKLNVKINAINGKDSDFTIELPRQLLKVYKTYENTVISLWELAMRKIYTGRYKHTLNISTSPTNVNIQYEPIAINNCYQPDFTMYSISYGFYNLLMNGPTSICVNSLCQQPIFTEAWIIVGISYCIESITTIALCCCKRCASEFSKHSNMTISHNWHCIN